MTCVRENDASIGNLSAVASVQPNVGSNRECFVPALVADSNFPLSQLHFRRLRRSCFSTVYPEHWSLCMRRLFFVVCSVLAIGSADLLHGQAVAAKAAPASTPAPPAPAAAPAKALLPDAFAGWVATDGPQVVTNGAQADSAQAEALKEYGFSDGALSNYKRGGETLALKALRFADASGAYGAYTLYRHDGWPKEQIGTGATSDHNRVLFWIGNIVVDATFSHIGPMSGSELRELAKELPVPGGPKSLAPPILSDLPQTSLDPQTTHYALGPAGYVGSGGVLPPEVVGFDRGAETVTATYSLRSNPATMTLIDYPTPQLAAAQEARIRAYIRAGSQAQPAWPKPLQDSDQASLEVRRSGPLVALVSGDAVPDESHKLLGMVHFDADVTSMAQPIGETEVAKTAKLLLGIAGIVVVGVSAALLLGFFLGGGRALYRIARGKPVSSVYEAEFIRIDLREEWVDPASRPALGIDRPHPKG